MRSRPDLHVAIDPWPPVAGSAFEALVTLTSRTDTPCEAIVLRLLGKERRYESSTTTGDSTHDHYAERTVVSLAAKIDGLVLTRGEHRRSVRFELPEDAPPAYRSPLASVEYELDVRVDIPWWPDRHERYAIPVTLPPSPPTKARRVTYVSQEGGPRGAELYLEASLASQAVVPGGTLEGAISLVNVAHHRVRSVEVALVAIERARIRSSAGPREVQRHVYRIHEGKPAEGASLAVRLRVPEGLTPTFQSEFLDLAWQLEVRAVITLGSDVVLAVPAVILPPAGDEAKSSRRADRAAPVGHERRALIWNELARRHGLHAHGDERLRGQLDEVTFELRPESHEAGVWAIAELSWPKLGLDLRVAEKKWLDKLVGEDLALERAFSARFSSAARERAQAVALLDGAVRGALLALERVALDDGGCVLAAPGAAFDLEALDAFATRTKQVAAALARAFSKIPAPAAMAAHAAAWREYAAENGGRFEPGRVFVHDATLEGERFDLGTLYEGTTPTATVVRLKLPLAARDEVLLAKALEDAGLEPVVDESGVTVRLEPALQTPRAAERTIHALAEVAAAARGAPRGPYR
jgi:hypothetical protein